MTLYDQSLTGTRVLDVQLSLDAHVSHYDRSHTDGQVHVGFMIAFTQEHRSLTSLCHFMIGLTHKELHLVR